MKSPVLPVLALGCLLSLSACVAAAVGGAGAVGVGAAEERGFQASVDDTKIKADINTAYIGNGFTLFNEVTVSVVEGRVMLTGSVEKSKTRADAVKLARQTDGVRQVIDEIQVSQQADINSAGKDALIASKLKSQMMFDSGIESINYTVDVVNRVVYLIGIAQDQKELNRVIALARGTEDVKKVINHVMLKTDPRRKSQ